MEHPHPNQTLTLTPTLTLTLILNLKPNPNAQHGSPLADASQDGGAGDVDATGARQRRDGTLLPDRGGAHAGHGRGASAGSGPPPLSWAGLLWPRTCARRRYPCGRTHSADPSFGHHAVPGLFLITMLRSIQEAEEHGDMVVVRRGSGRGYRSIVYKVAIK